MATLQQLEQALIAADRAGATNDARILAAAIIEARKDQANMIPGSVVPGTAPQAPQPTVTDQVIGAGEAALTLGTGIVGGTLGTIGGTLKGIAEQLLSGQFGTPQAARLVEESAMKGAEALTYAPRTQAGQEQAAAVAEAAQGLIPFAGLAGETAALAGASRGAAQPAVAAARNVAGKAVEAVKERIPGAGSSAKKPTAGTQASGGAAGVDAATLRQSRAEELPVPIRLTEGQKSREFGQQRFERETSKDPALGEPIRDRMREQNAQLQQNMDAFIDLTGAEATDLTSIGLSTEKALRTRAARDKVKIRTLYKEAEKAGEMEAPVTLQGIADFLVEKAPEAEVADVLKAARLKALQLGIIEEVEGGGLAAVPSPLKRIELFRQSINDATNSADSRSVKFAGDLKRIVDDTTEGLGGDLYKQARAARRRYAENYESIGLIKNILGTKRGTTDRAIAMEDILRRSLLEPSTSTATVRQLRRLLQTEGADGQQAWRDLQGGVIQHIKDQATKNVARDEAGNPLVSAAQLDRTITTLDKGGKLDFIFGKKGAEQLRTLNDVAKDVLVATPGSVNTSNTASVLLAALDGGLIASGGPAGVPVPVLTGLRILGSKVKDSRTRARVRKALGEDSTRKD